MDVQERQAHFKHKPRFPSPGWRPKPILPHTKRRPNSKVAMSRRASALEAFRHNPTDGSFAPLFDRTRTCTKCPNLRFLSYYHGHHIFWYIFIICALSSWPLYTSDNCWLNLSRAAKQTQTGGSYSVKLQAVLVVSPII